MLGQVETSTYFQVALFIVLLAGFYYYQQKLPGFRLLGLALGRIVMMVLVFSYFSLTWSSAVNPSLRTTSVFGLFLVNLYLLWQVIVTRAELPYRLALQAFPQEVERSPLLEKIIRTGRRYYYLRHFWSALFSGSLFRAYLHGLAVDRIRQDLKHLLHQQGVDRELITCRTMITFLKRKLAADTTLPAEFKELMSRAIAELSEHPWLEEQINEFLIKLMESPEEFYIAEESNLLGKEGDTLKR